MCPLSGWTDFLSLIWQCHKIGIVKLCCGVQVELVKQTYYKRPVFAATSSSRTPIKCCDVTWTEADEETLKETQQWRERVDRERHRPHDFPQGTTSWGKKEKEIDDDHMKMFYHMQHISGASTERQLCMRAENSCRQKTMPRIVCTKNKPHCPNGGNTTHSAHLAHK